MLSRQSVPLPSGDTRPASSAPVKLAERWRPPSAEELSRELSPFQIDGLIACGGMGAVYRGVQKSLGRDVAIKVLSEELAKDNVFIARFEREARTLARLQHPGIVAVHDFGTTPSGYVWFAMEFVDGTDLAQLLKSGTRPPVERVLEIVAQICDALQHAHDQNILHRDVKPANMMITKQGRCKLADFGLARNVEVDAGLTMAHHTVGTPAYMAPEQMFGISDRRSDLYAVGVVFYEMLTGHRPTGTWEVPSIEAGVDRKLDAIVLKAINQDPEQRYQQAWELLADINAFRNGTTAIHLASSPPQAQQAPQTSVPPPQGEYTTLPSAIPATSTETEASYPALPGYDAPVARRPMPSPATEVPAHLISRTMPQMQRPNQPPTRPMSRAEAEQIRRGVLPPIAPPPKPYANKSALPLWQIVTGVGAIAALLLVMFFTAAKPELRVYDFKTGNQRTSLDVQIGEEPDGLCAEVKNGELQVQPRLPAGLEFVARSIGDTKLYYLSGVPRANAKVETLSLSLTARSGNKVSSKVGLTMRVKARPVQWQIDGIQELTFVQDQPLRGYNKIVVGAEDVTTEWSPSNPGIDVRASAVEPTTWSLEGTPVTSGTFTLGITAVATRGGTPQTRPLQIVIVPPPSAPAVVQPPPPPAPASLEWRDFQLPVTVGAEQAVAADMILVRGAAKVDADWLPSTPSGLSVTNVAPGDWALKGTATTPGAYQLHLTATPAGGSPQTRATTVYVTPRDMPTTGNSEVDRRMRDFLLERIERAPASFTEGEKLSLRQIVASLKQPRLIAGIRFRSDQTSLDPRDQRILRALLTNSENSKLFASSDCQILVVGYAPNATPAGTALSRERAAAVDNILRTSIGRGARLCGDYGPTDAKTATSASGISDVEIYAGVLKIPDFLRTTADRFCFSFNQRHGAQ